MLGLEVRCPDPTVTFSNPVLPPFLEAIRVRGLRAGDGSVDLVITRHTDDVGINVLGRTGRVGVVTVK